MKAAIKNSLLLSGALALLALTACSENAGAAAKTNAKSGTTHGLPKLLDLGAHECIPCKLMAPILDELATEYKGVFDVEFVDVWMSENVEKAKAHGVEAIPTQIFFDAKGEELWRHVGFISKEDILKKWKELGYDMAKGAETAVEGNPLPTR